ncbi:nucleoside-diphosphate-sugar epimerase [Ancylobacter aquaticus]|uniref:Nucleoside-diphosphate-sugar epimerase n=1 Tax=Ancylobacter aquaticus TaxID=100 RepID=A0A4R1I0C4_ANCAQ|nr:SDR family oxidoreductase [Ancylobacter aquaticus]TCK28138.1 nucleoside-diphosphate-sugar epimerase [Ancylobacter aquaticus]
MQVFVTGATGFVGSAVTAELLANGHGVLGLARSDRSADGLRQAGAEVLRGELEAPETLREGARSCDAIIHTGFIHDFARYAQACAIDRAAIEAVGAAIEGTGKAFIVTAGLAGLAVAGNPVTENDVAPPPSDLYPRASDMAARTLSARGIPTAIMRLPPSVHGRGDHGFVPMLIDMAREKGRSAYIGQGTNAWPAVHVADAARAFRLAIERGPSAETFHAAGELGIPFREIAQAIAAGLDLPCVSLSPDEAREHFGWFARFTALDEPAASERTRRLLGWQPTGPDLLTDIGQAGYFPVGAH